MTLYGHVLCSGRVAFDKNGFIILKARRMWGHGKMSKVKRGDKDCQKEILIHGTP